MTGVFDLEYRIYLLCGQQMQIIIIVVNPSWHPKWIHIVSMPAHLTGTIWDSLIDSYHNLF